MRRLVRQWFCRLKRDFAGYCSSVGAVASFEMGFDRAFPLLLLAFVFEFKRIVTRIQFVFATAQVLQTVVRGC